ncbi:MAG: hypothetical protein K0Q84_263 [Arthrobacter sp.]|jgi:hypothetical protein|nr:hypothetical protein [Arthrobacter sp.]
MITALAQRIRTECSAELSLFQNQVLSLMRQDIGTGGLEGAATAMARRPSLASSGATVEIVGFIEWQPAARAASVGITVVLRLGAGNSAGAWQAAWRPVCQQSAGGGPDAGILWEEAHAWASAVADGPWAAAEFLGCEEAPAGPVFHYLLKEPVAFYTAPGLQAAL